MCSSWNFREVKAFIVLSWNLKKSYTPQGEESYMLKNEQKDIGTATDEDVVVSAPVQKLVDASRDDPPYNNDSYPGYDKENMYVGVKYSFE